MGNAETMKDISKFIDWCNKNGVKPNNGDALREYMRMSKFQKAYNLSIAKIKGSMAENGISQGDIARYIGMSEMQMSRKFSGKTDFSVTELLSIAELLSVEPQVFFVPKVDNLSTNNIN